VTRPQKSFVQVTSCRLWRAKLAECWELVLCRKSGRARQGQKRLAEAECQHRAVAGEASTKRLQALGIGNARETSEKLLAAMRSREVTR
jgi:hypothetical protein